MPAFLNALVAGLLQGGVYALLAFSLALLFSTMRLINFAHGDLLTLALYTVVLQTAVGVPLLLAGVATVLAMGAIGLIMYLGVFSATLRSSDRGLAQVLGTLGVSLVIQNSLLGGFGGDTRTYELPVDPTWAIGPVYITFSRAAPFLVLVLVLVGMWLFMTRTRVGLNARAVAENRDFAVLSGVSIRTTYLVVTSVSLLLLGVAATAMAPATLVYPTTGFNLLLVAFMAVVIGGLGSLFGSVIGGITLGGIEAVAGLYASAMWAPAFMYVAFVVILLVRPHGLFGDHSWRMQ